MFISFALIDQPWEPQLFEERLAQLPLFSRERILQYKGWQEQQLRVAGRLLLQEWLKTKGFSLKDLQHIPPHKPLIPGTTLDFSISHSGSLVAFAGVDAGRVGLDVEQIVPLEAAVIADYLSVYEQRKNTPLEIWTRKEAVLKAAGKGVADVSPALVEAAEEVVCFEEVKYRTRVLRLQEGYCAVVATDTEDEVKEIREVRFAGLTDT